VSPILLLDEFSFLRGTLAENGEEGERDASCPLGRTKTS
jgi:hypothetical protein